MSSWFLRTFEMVTTETPRSRAMSFMRTAIGFIMTAIAGRGASSAATHVMSLGHRPHEAAELNLLFQPARPDQFIVPHRDIGAAVAHAHGPVAENVRGLDDGDRLKIQPPEQVRGFFKTERRNFPAIPSRPRSRG